MFPTFKTVSYNHQLCYKTGTVFKGFLLTFEKFVKRQILILQTNLYCTFMCKKSSIVTKSIKSKNMLQVVFPVFCRHVFLTFDIHRIKLAALRNRDSSTLLALFPEVNKQQKSKICALDKRIYFID